MTKPGPTWKELHERISETGRKLDRTITYAENIPKAAGPVIPHLEKAHENLRAAYEQTGNLYEATR